MPIPQKRRKELTTTFILARANTPWLKLMVMACNLPIIVRRDWYALIELEPGRWAVEFVRDLLAAGLTAGAEGETIKLAKLSLPHPLRPAISVDANQVGWGMARKRMMQSPYRRLIILEEGRPVGLLCEDKRRGSPLKSVQAALNAIPLVPDEILYRCQCGHSILLNTGPTEKETLDPDGYVECPVCHKKHRLDLNPEVMSIRQSMLVEVWRHLSKRNR